GRRKHGPAMLEDAGRNPLERPRNRLDSRLGKSKSSHDFLRIERSAIHPIEPHRDRITADTTGRDFERGPVGANGNGPNRMRAGAMAPSAAVTAMIAERTANSIRMLRTSRTRAPSSPAAKAGAKRNLLSAAIPSSAATSPSFDSSVHP